MKRERILVKAADLLDLPSDIVAGLPRVEITGGRELLMENHHGILEYGGECIVIHGGRVMVRVSGAGLELTAVTADELRLRGERITGVEFLY